MANLAGLPIDKDVRENTGAFTVLPKGRYRMVIVSDELADNSKGTGKILKIKHQVTAGEFKGVELTNNLNITNASSVAQAIGQGTLRRICSICRVEFPPADTRKLYGIPMDADVTVETFVSNTTGKELQSNKISGYNPVSTAPPEVDNPKTGEPEPW